LQTPWMLQGNSTLASHIPVRRSIQANVPRYGFLDTDLTMARAAVSTNSW